MSRHVTGISTQNLTNRLEFEESVNRLIVRRPLERASEEGKEQDNERPGRARQPNDVATVFSLGYAFWFSWLDGY
jgi:hypothetical protein